MKDRKKTKRKSTLGGAREEELSQEDYPDDHDYDDGAFRFS